ncbi:chloroplastic group IIA intron splicing facilitator CRS1, chloroplastic [Humulus lupulus]|uniref:chloroplastic group IIA intron splicing facilitator CRS1, chloroplastic n=1 Tax=Humulus lupulus TaxID=3486 RepID=UPI002B40F59B|nr:chloroplastic group IIA intron splicing facilitator CRS1, chloroplastic [Humulus lupulus]XP_062107404.1 chloroplastic group IIA intron splicing facilitator CRS1, chloroplastic [Humulus lupulus]XP_062107405.1 chloroplastic group IIA intron splicing facilitator CRS1, chloroplastic [Humulus lupulus]XP_062107406.1 chloroplastic group IIA intron splicing facilitator CRS1, chloroplastic [Humulus lupulus]XP_062107407.1 chloroplastic group IIA intron splicing facilitator CRS1, chloroplastic [Humulus
MPAILFFYPSPSSSSLLNSPYLSYNSSSTPYSHSCLLISSSFNPKPHHNSKHTNYASHSTSLNSTQPNSNSTSDSQLPLEPISRSDAASSIKMPTAPWMHGSLLVEPHEVVNLSKPSNGKRAKAEKSRGELTDKLVGRRGKNAIKKISRKIQKLGEKVDIEETQRGSEELGIGDYLTRLDEAGDSKMRGKVPWERDESFVFRRMKKDKIVTAAELSLEKELLERLRSEAYKIRKWVKVKKAGVTQAVVDDIKFTWKKNELAMVKFDIPLCRNMDRAHEILELKTGGLVVWRRKDTLVIYRGSNCHSTSETIPKMYPSFSGYHKTSSTDHGLLKMGKGSPSVVNSNENILNGKLSFKSVKVESAHAFIFENDIKFQPNGSLYERETDRLLDGLGPRFVDWWMHKPLPVDADLLPEVVPGFRPPFRRCPPKTRSKLTDDELTYLRKLAKSLPTHFVLGRNRKLQGLAAAILKLWEKCHIAKIAVKLGVPNTDNKQMANELKCLTGGDLLLRNKFIIIIYRGKDFLPCQIADLISKREVELERCQLHEEHARLEVIEKFCVADEPQGNTQSAGTLSEFHDIQLEYGDSEEENRMVKLPLQAEKERIRREIRKQERKLFILNSKIEKSTKDLLKLNAAWKPSEKDADQEMLTDEERECFRMIGMKMHSVLVLGRRGIFDGVMEGLHQHWKHREVAKVITMQRLFHQVMYTAKFLEVESGGILISVEKLKEGFAVIIYRGKNYQRPLKLISGNLLTKRKALRRSLEMQRIGSLKFFAYQRKRAISDLKLKLETLYDILKAE